MRQNYSSGQEIIFQDLNTMQGRMERQFYDRILLEILQGTKDAFFQDGLKVIYTGATGATVKLGLGLQEVSGAASTEPMIQPLYRSADVNIIFDTPDNADPRIDLVVVKAARADAETDNRKFKDEFSEDITTESTVVATDWQAEILIVKGTPAGSPVAPAVPAGYLKVAECLIRASVGMQNQNDVTDTRAALPFASSTGGTGTEAYDAVVGDTSLIGVTYETLKAALDNAQPGWRILVTRSEDVDAIPQVNDANIEIVFKKGVSFTKDGVASGLRISANDCTVRHPRFVDFDAAGDEGILIDSGVLRTYIEAPRFSNCDTAVDNQGDDTFAPVIWEE